MATIVNTCNSADGAATNDPLQMSVPVQLAPSPASRCETETLVSNVLPANNKSSVPRQAPETTTTPPEKMDKLFSALSSAAVLSAAGSTDDTTLPAGTSARLAKVFTEVHAGTVTSQPPPGSPASRSAVRGSLKQGGTNERSAVHDQTAATKSSGVPPLGAHRVMKTAPGSKTQPKINRKMNTNDVSRPVKSGKGTSKVTANCNGKKPERHRKLLMCVDPDCGVHVETCPDHVCVAAPPAKKARARSRRAVAQGATSPKKKARPSPKKKKAQRSKHTQTVSSSGQGSMSLFLSITNGSTASTQVNHRWQAEKGCLTRSANCIPNRSNAQLTTTPLSLPVPASDSTNNPSRQKHRQDPQLVTCPRNFSPYLASLLSDSRAVKQRLTEHKDSGRESATVLLAASDQAPSSPRQLEAEEMSFWDTTRIKQEVTECKNDDSAEDHVAPCEVSNEELILPDVPDPADLFNGARIKEEAVDCEDSLMNQRHLLTGESEAASLLGATWIQPELMQGEDNCVERCTVSPGSHRPEETKIKQEPMECDDSSAGAGSVVPLVVPEQESLSLQQPELMMDPGYSLAGYEADGVAFIKQEEDPAM